VDDEKIIINSLTSDLKNLFGDKFAVESAEGGEDAIALFKELISDNCVVPLIITDYLMPEMKGDELLKEVHALSPSTLKIMLTGQATLEGVSNAINWANLYRYIGKPWEKGDLKLTVAEALKSYFKDRQLEEHNDELKKLNLSLEEKVNVRTAELEEKNKNITNSIRYAQRIQNAILPIETKLEKLLKDYFVIYLPKDIVSGDFYWAEKFYNAENDPITLFAAVDCTGHGVPGAFMSLMGYNGLSLAVKEAGLDQPGEILTFLGNYIRKMLRQRKDTPNIKDGMDLILCSLNRKKMVLQYAGVHNTSCIIRNGEVITLKSENHSIGDRFTTSFNGYTTHQIPLKNDDCIYLYTDGFSDQFGGKDFTKFMSKRFKELLVEVQPLDMKAQRKKLVETFEKWKGERNQIDDVLIIGVKV
jgi:sigma-B regulation protein RsbU (phosphoserine phosphatase)